MGVKSVKKTERIGETFITNEGYEIEIVEYFNNQNCTIKFEDGLILYNKVVGHIIRGGIKNPNHKSIYGVGFIGYGKYKNKINNKKTKVSECWRGMLDRCYNTKFHITRPTYKDCTVCDEWHNFQNFAKWFDEFYVDGYALDKDILIKGNKVYSPTTCCFVPPEINLIFGKCTGRRGEYPIGVSYHKHTNKLEVRIHKSNIVERYRGYDCPIKAFEKYKEIKEAYIKEVADKYKSTITKECYDALYNYKVDITD